MMKKRKTAGAAAVLCCTAVLGILLGKAGVFGPAFRNTGERTEAAGGAAGIMAGQDMVFTSDTGTDILTRHALPGFERMEKNDRDNYVNSLQVIKKAELLGIGERDFLYPEMRMSDIEKAVGSMDDGYGTEKAHVDFHGDSSGELQQVVDDNPGAVIDIYSDSIKLDDTVTLRDGTMLCGNGVKLVSDGVKYGFMGENVSDVYISGVCIDGNMDYGMYFIDCDNISVSQCRINGLAQKPVCIIGTTEGVSIRNNTMCANRAGGLYIAGNVSKGIVDSNDIKDNGGTSNWMAGIVLTNVMPDDRHDIWETFDEAHHFPYKENLYAQQDCPHDIIVGNNRVMDNNASGIYSDGACMCYVLNNTVYGNDKEGICLDYGTIGFYLKENVFKRNGRRMRQTDRDLEMDFVLAAGRMEDGSAKSKLPGVSLDNTAYDILENNIVAENYGGGIKMVRTTVRTLVMENIVRDNNLGQNDMFHFFGIEIGAAVADVESTDMDFTPDYENIICRNSITGNHYSGIFVGEDCYVNDIFDNVIMESQMFAVEAVSKKFNSIVNNIFSAGIRNEYTDLEKEGGV